MSSKAQRNQSKAIMVMAVFALLVAILVMLYPTTGW